MWSNGISAESSQIVNKMSFLHYYCSVFHFHTGATASHLPWKMLESPKFSRCKKLYFVKMLH